MKLSWKRKGERDYRCSSDTEGWMAFVFAAPRAYMWAWAVWFRGGKASGVEFTFQAAKRKAAEMIERRGELRP